MNKEALKNQVKENLKFVKASYEDSDEPGFTSMFVVEAMKDGKPTGVGAGSSGHLYFLLGSVLFDHRHHA